MADTDQGPLIPDHTKRAVVVLAYLFLYSVAMFTLPFVAFFGVRHALLEYTSLSYIGACGWAVFAAVVVVNTIIFMYVYKAYHEKEYDEHGNEIDQHSYPSVAPASKDRDGLNLKED